MVTPCPPCNTRHWMQHKYAGHTHLQLVMNNILKQSSLHWLIFTSTLAKWFMKWYKLLNEINIWSSQRRDTGTLNLRCLSVKINVPLRFLYLHRDLTWFRWRATNLNAHNMFWGVFRPQPAGSKPTQHVLGVFCHNILLGFW
jgi:hypothetical protein